MDGRDSGGTGRRGTSRRIRDVAAGAESGRLRLTREIATALAVIVRRLRLPLLLVALLPIVPAALLLVVAGAIGGQTGGGLAALAVIALVPAGWLLWRRRQLMWAVEPVDALAGEIGTAFDVTDAWSEGRSTLRKIREFGREGWRPLRLARGAWTGLRFALSLFERVTDLPRIAPFTPTRLTTTSYLGIACVVGAAVVMLADVVAVMALLVEALS
ncbi:MAG: hypothetical protein ACRDVZ_02125 [Jiangellaceae bacterium]